MTAVQLTIFDELADAADSIVCPHCGHEWKPGSDGLPTLAGHIQGSPGWGYAASETGHCTNQQIALYQLGNQQHMGLVENPPRFTTDLIGAILRAKQHGCTDKQTQTVLTSSRARAGDS